MEKNFTDVLKEATKDILTEEVLKELELTFNSAVDNKVKIHVEKALLEQDADYSQKLEKLIEAIDTDHTNKLNKVVETLEADRTAKLKAIVEKYENTINEEAGNFKEDLVNNISKYLELYLDEKVPSTQISEAVNSKKAEKMLEALRGTLAVDMALSKDSIKEAVIDGKNRLNEAAEQLKASNAKIEELNKALAAVSAEITLEKKLNNLPEDKKVHLKKLLAGKSAEYINENFDYTLGLFDKTEEERISNLKQEAVNESVAANVDSPVTAVVNESVKNEAEAADPSFNAYMSELKKY